MSDALAQWLALRETADTAARSTRLTQAVSKTLDPRGPLRVLDLATGTGANIRYLIDRLDADRQHWRAVDRNPILLAHLRERMSGWPSARGRAWELETREIDLGTLDSTIFGDRDLVTASALLDLVSESWLRALAAECRAAGAAALFAITYDGRSVCSPAEPEDAMVLRLFNEHQRRDKGLGGPAAGPDAVAAAVRCFTEAGYHVETAPSDWTLAPADAALQRELIDGWAHAAGETHPDAASRIADWRSRRIGHVDAARSHIVVGHHDIAAWM